MIASIATYPHEVLRTRLQIQKRARAAQGAEAEAFEGVIKTFQRILAEEGVAGFYRGMGTNLLRTVPASALTILSYELIMRRMLRMTHSEHELREKREQEDKKKHEAQQGR